MIETLKPTFRDRLRSMYAGEPQQGSTGSVEIDELVRIQAPAGMWLYDLCLNLKPQRTLEVGMAYGFSTLCILAAIEKLGSGNHTAIDPFQAESFHNVGLNNVAVVCMQRHFTLVSERSVQLALRVVRWVATL